MVHVIEVSQQIDINGVADPHPLPVIMQFESVTKIKASVPADTIDYEVSVMAGSSEYIGLLVLAPHSDSEEITYKVNNAGSDELSLAYANLYIGSSMIKLLDVNIETIYFTNLSVNELDVDIIVARDPTP